MITREDLYFNSEPDFRGEPVYTPQAPGDEAAAPISVNPAPPPAPMQDAAIAASAAVVALPTPTRAVSNLPVPVVNVPSRFSAADYGAAGRALLPRGRAWSDEPNSVQSQVMAAIGVALARIDARATGLLSGVMPGAPSTMLPEWEAALGLPDPCVGDAPSIAQRLDQVRSRFVGAGGQSRQRYIDFAASLGFTIAISVYKPGQAGLPAGGPAANSDAWWFTWGVRVTASTGVLPVDVLMCELDAIKPAETTVLLLS